MSKHTPGTWIARKGMSYPAVVVTKDNVEFIYINQRECALANAHLIAAAPETYGSCKDYETTLILIQNALIMMEHGQSAELPSRELVDQQLAKVRAAIAKAEGRS